MRRLLSLGARRSGSQFVDRHERRTPVTKVLAPMRDQVMAAWETVTLVLGDDSPLPETDAEVEYLVQRLRGHVAQLGARVAPGTPALLSAQRLCSESIPEGFMPSRVYLVRLAEATQELMTHVERGSPELISVQGRRPWRKPKVNVQRGAVFAVALACLVFAASMPRI